MGQPSTAHNRDAWLIAAAAGAWLAGAAAFGLPGLTMDWGRDLVVFFGQINALEHGQVPYRDFRTSMGALPFYLPWFGYRLGGGFAGALEIGGLLAAALLLPCIVVALRVRLGLPTALATLLCLTAVAATPVYLGYHVPSQVGFYNRWASAALAALFLFAVPPTREHPRADGAGMAALLLFLFFVKASYFAVGLAFVLGFGAVLGLFRRAALIGAGGFLAVVVAVQAATGLIDDYLAELAHSFNVSGVSWYAREGFLANSLSRSASYYGVFAVACIVAFVGEASVCWRRWLFMLFAAFACLAIQGHDAGFYGPFALLAPMALLAARTSVRPWRRWLAVCLGLFMLPFLAAAPRTAFDLHRDDSLQAAELPRMTGVYVILLSRASPRGHHALSYVVDELAAGLRLLEQNGIGDGVFGLDYYNYFPVLLDVPPLPGRLAVLMPERTMNRDRAPRPATLLRHAPYVMVPKASNSERRALLALYGKHLRASYRRLDSNDHWQLWERRRP